ncbi:MAG TPA: NAD(P)-binding protein [Candidatus Binataceae bacterium]|nr:NAD(P)-binding protein [Candidatus Binataceae bacterium]
MKKRARDQRPIEVAVVGGGCGGIAAAFELSRPQHRGKYHVTVYQLGWRLGGKGASGRGVANRIEEHGLHLWMGFYENAFRLLRECYAELGRDPRTHPMADWRDAFVAEPFIGVGGAHSGERGRSWSVHFPPGDGLPGDPLSGYNPFTLASYMVRTAMLMQTLLGSAPTADDAGESDSGATSSSESPAARGLYDDLGAILPRLLKYGALTTVTGLISAARFIELIFKTASITLPDGLLALIEAMAESLHRQFNAIAESDPDLRPVWEVIDLLLAFQRGVLRFNLLNDPRGFDALNDYDTREWLRLNGAAQHSVNSDMMRGLYDLAMAYEDGHPRRPRMAAGLGLRACLRMFFTYRGAMMWKMQAGMGDVVFAPFYEVLRKRGVHFRFFHRLRKVELGDDARGAAHVTTLDFDVQAEIKDGLEYQPLIDRRGLPCWPSRPDYDQLRDGERLRAESCDFESHWEEPRAGRKTLRVGEDFDLVVLAIGLGAIPHVCKAILARDQRWRAMVQRVKTIPTQAFQIWLREDMETLGWKELPTTMSGYAKPFDTWADMRHLAVQEDWPCRPRAIVYSCGAMHESAQSRGRRDSSYASASSAQVRREAVRWLNRHGGDILPNAVHASGGFRWELLIDAAETAAGSGKHGAARFTSQFWTANVNPSDRYVLSLPGSTEYRISPLDYTYDNLTIAGDWTSCGLNVGCVESAFISGRLAAHAIAAAPALEEIIGYDHP